MYLYSGQCSTPFASTVLRDTETTATFTKTSGAARGSVGAFTYNLEDVETKQTKLKMAVMFQVPFDYTQYSNYCAVGICDKDKPCDYNLFHEMYYNKPTWFIRQKACCKQTCNVEGFIMKIFMTDQSESTLTVEVQEQQNV